MLNTVIIMGRLTATPELKTTNSGISVSSFKVAVDREYGKDKQTDFIPCQAWRGTAEFVTKYFIKGQMIAVVGSLQQSSYTDKNGNKRTSYDVVVDEAHFGGAKEQKAEPNVNFEDVDTSEFEELDMTDGDLPF